MNIKVFKTNSFPSIEKQSNVSTLRIVYMEFTLLSQISYYFKEAKKATFCQNCILYKLSLGQILKNEIFLELFFHYKDDFSGKKNC